MSMSRYFSLESHMPSFSGYTLIRGETGQKYTPGESFLQGGI
jgi:hypothetical protein